MKKLLLLVFCISLVGCAFIQGQKVNWEACKSDPVCSENAKSWQDRTEVASTIIASAVPVPGAAAAPKVLGYIAFGISMLLGGRALTKKKKETPVV